MLGTNLITGFNSPYQDVFCTFAPEISSIKNETTNITLTVTTSSPLLEYWGWNITYLNGTTITVAYNASNPTYNLTNNSGGTLNATLYLWNTTGVSVHGFFKHQLYNYTGYCDYYYTVYDYVPYPFINATAQGALNRFQAGTSGFSNAFLSVMAIISAFVVAAWAGRISPFIGAVMFLVVLGAFTGIGFIRLEFFIILAIVVTSLGIVIYGGRQ
jgi:hypothetical protein